MKVQAAASGPDPKSFVEDGQLYCWSLQEEASFGIRDVRQWLMDDG
jgi:hypothetical protein